MCMHVLILCHSYIPYIVQPSTDEYVLPRITQQYYLLKRFVTVLGQILSNKTGMNLEHNFAGQLLDMYQLSYTSTITVRKIVSYLFSLFLVAYNLNQNTPGVKSYGQELKKPG